MELYREIQVVCKSFLLLLVPNGEFKSQQLIDARIREYAPDGLIGYV